MTQSNIQKLREIGGHLVDPDIAVRIFEELPDAIVVVDQAATIQLVNKQTEMLFGYHRIDLFDQPIEILVPEDARERHAEHRSGFLLDPRTRPMGLGMALQGRRKDGSQFEAEINLSPIVTRGGIFVLAVIRRKR